MDPISGAASIFAVVSLALQLVGSVDNARRFLRNIKDAPVEFQRLAESLDQLHLLLSDITDSLTRYNGLKGMPRPPQSLGMALISCPSRLDELEPLKKSAKLLLTASKGKASKSWALLKLSMRRKDVDEYDKHVHKAITALQVAMSLYSLDVQ
jgi:hypothetical protein